MVGEAEKEMRMGLVGLTWAQKLFDNSVGGGGGGCLATMISFSMANNLGFDLNSGDQLQGGPVHDFLAMILVNFMICQEEIHSMIQLWGWGWVGGVGDDNEFYAMSKITLD
jgi:hypothetical protein